MPQPILGLHHVTAIATDPQRNVDFYTEVLGLRLVKRTVNFDDPETYHLYFGDDVGTPGTIITFFPWPGAPRGTLGAGETAATAFRALAGSLGYWQKRLHSASIPAEAAGERFGSPVLRFNDPDGTRLEIIGTDDDAAITPSRVADVPAPHALRGFHGVTLNERALDATAELLKLMGFQQSGQEGTRLRFVSGHAAAGRIVDVVIDSRLDYGRLGAGSVHHIAFRVPDDPSQLEWREVLASHDLHVTPVRDRMYFHSIYFRESGGVLFELATDPPGFAYDEPAESLGETLRLPPWLETRRPVLERTLPSIELPHLRPETSHE
jgi:glyoxalase family protein